MKARLLNDLKAKLNLIPTCADYNELLDYATETTGRSRYAIFDGQGLATYAQWAVFLGLAK